MSLDIIKNILQKRLIETTIKKSDKSRQQKNFQYIFSLADTLIGGKPVITSGGGGSSDSDFRWDGHRPDEEEEA